MEIKLTGSTADVVFGALFKKVKACSLQCVQFFKNSVLGAVVFRYKYLGHLTISVFRTTATLLGIQIVKNRHTSRITKHLARLRANKANSSLYLQKAHKGNAVD